MSDEPRVQQLVDELLDSERTPEEVCADCPELLAAVRERSQQMLRVVEAELDAMFPTPGPDQDVDTRVSRNSAAGLPHIPGYEMESVLGRGGMGIVYKARHVRLNRPVALKMLLAGAYAGVAERERFLREAEAVAGLRHANLVQVHDVGEHDGRPYFTMEYVEGGSLAQRLTGTPLNACYGAALVTTLAEAVQVAHQGGIIHRDLKPANILLQRKSGFPISNSPSSEAKALKVVPEAISDFDPKIADFGLARHLDTGPALTLSGVRVGTPSYMAPEQALGKTRATGPSVDIYALGAVLYELLTGRPPFRGETAAETELQVIRQEPVPPARLNARVPRDLETICLKCLQKEPARRYASAAALADDLRRFREGRPIQARPVGLGTRLWRWGRRNPTVAALIAAVLVVAGLAIGGGFWLERQHAERREEAARQEERESQAVQVALEKAAALQQQGRWQEARAVFDDVQNFLSASAAEHLRARLRQARTDADMAAELETIRQRISALAKMDDPDAQALQKLYADAFRNYGIALLTLKSADAAARIRASSIHETLLAHLHQWLRLVSDEKQNHFLEVLDQADDDDWRRAFRGALIEKNADKLKALADAPETKDQPPIILSVLGGALLVDKHSNAALALLQKAQQLHPGDFWINYLLGLYWNKERPREAVGFFRVAVAMRPTNDQAYVMLARALRDSEDADGAIAAFRQSVELNPNFAAAKDLIVALVQRGRLEEARAAWENLLEREPRDHEAWYGYAELCLFLGKTDEYRRARRALLERFGATTNPFDAERTARACMLLPGTEDELRQAADLAGRAVAERAGDKWGHPYFEFVHGLAEYRQEQFERAITTMRSDASTVLGPAPGLVVAMALHRSGQVAEARKTLAKAILAHDWRAMQFPVLDPSGWVYQILRREAESLMLPNLQAFLDGKYQPRDNDERLAFLGACQFLNRTRAMARLYADAFFTAPSLAADLGPGHCYNAARAAALAGCGHGSDATGLGDEERARLREQARQWLRAELTARVSALGAGSKATRGANRLALTRWRNELDLACVRDPDELNKLPEGERREFVALWADVAAVLALPER